MSAPFEVKSCCVSGHIHSGTPKGTVSNVYTLPTYIATPEGGSKAKTAVFLTDIFGFDLPNVRLLADEWAEKGYYVLVPDILKGDPIPHDLLNAIVPNLNEQKRQSFATKAANGIKAGAAYGPWAIKHREAVTLPVVTEYLKAVRADSTVGKITTVGFCFGGRYAIIAAGKDSVVDAAVAYHPSGVSIPDDLTSLSRPTLIAIGDVDSIMPMSEVEKAISVFNDLKEKNKSAGLEVKVYPHAVHGFSVRGDQENDEERKLKEDAFKDAQAFLDKYL